MSWQEFIQSTSSKPEHPLTEGEQEVLLCLEPDKTQTKKELFIAYNSRYYPIESEAFTQRLKNIYRKFQIVNKGYKLPKLRQVLREQFKAYKNNDIFFNRIGLSHVYPRFPRDRFSQALEKAMNAELNVEKQVDILQTFAPNLNDYYEYLVECLHRQVKIRILLAWPYSQAAKIRAAVLSKYANRHSHEEVNIFNAVVENLETIERIIEVVGVSPHLQLKLYDTLPSLAIYRAGNYLLAAPFLHGSLAVNNFQLELNLNTSDGTITETLQQDFELMWEVAREFCPNPDRNWRNDLKILFSD